VTVFTESKAELRMNIARSGDRDLAMDLKTGTETSVAREAVDASIRIGDAMSHFERLRRQQYFIRSLHKTTNANALPYDPLRSARFIV